MKGYIQPLRLLQLPCIPAGPDVAPTLEVHTGTCARWRGELCDGTRRHVANLSGI